ncbi:hypothetical protein A2W24_03210 [Microgenomates group bacterium RBG_16_45_19]|nr:MAG: hypothetical protein A2W24_03210 [Microgenomates group bacterium RBG_16_45_19]
MQAMTVPPFLKDLNPAQQQAVTHTGSPLLILAGAGSGKTRALTYRAAYLIAQGVPRQRILLTTFTNKAAQEMQRRLYRLVGYRLPLAGTFHSLCARWLRQHGQAINLSPDFSIYDTADQIQLLKQVLRDLKLDPKEHRLSPLLHYLESAKQELLTPADYAALARGPAQTTAARVYTHYQKLLFQANALDFNDLLFMAVTLFQSAADIRQRYQEQLLHLLIDEYQDTNRAQYRLTQLLATKHQNLCVVGDASQAIYSWRGADYRNLSLLKRDFPNLTIIKLEQNYRSTQNILDAAHGVIAQNSLHPILTLWTQAAKGALVGLYPAANEYAEVDFILQTLADRRRRFHLNLTDFTVLYRTNAQSRVLEEVFIRAGIPYVLVGGVKFYERKEVKDVVSYLRLAANPQDSVSRERLEKLGRRRLSSFDNWRETADLTRSPAVLLDELLAVTQYLSRYDPKVVEDLYRLENVQELRSVAQNFKSLSAFLENVALVEPDTGRQGWVAPRGQMNHQPDQDAVIFMTLHASKGLEFDTVFIIGLEEGLLPHSRSLLSQADLEEERRLCYVGITRAKQQVYLSYALSRLYFGTRARNEPSRFLAEIPATVTESLGASSPPPPVASPLSEKLLDQFLNDEIDIDAFLHG